MLEKLTGVYGLFNQAMQGGVVGGVPQLTQPALPAGEVKVEPAPKPELLFPMSAPPEVELDRIVVLPRIRKAVGDLKELKESILAFGVLAPIIVRRRKDDGANFELVKGNRRLHACREVGMKSVPVKVVDLERSVDGEIDCTVMCKQFTVSERVAIGLMTEADLGERRGRPKEDATTASKVMATQVAPWKRAGFGNQETYRQAKAVVASGDAALIAAMDGGELSVNAAYNTLKDKKQDEQPKVKDAKDEGEGEGAGNAPESQSSTDKGKKRSAGPFAPSRSPKTTALADEPKPNGTDAEIKASKILPGIRALLNEHGALSLTPKIEEAEGGHVLVLPKENRRLALVVAALEVQNLNQLIDEGTFFVTVAK